MISQLGGAAEACVDVLSGSVVSEAGLAVIFVLRICFNLWTSGLGELHA